MPILLQVIVGCVPSAVVLIIWFLDRNAKKADRKEDILLMHDAKISKIESQVEEIGRVVNDLSAIQKMTCDGLGYVIDGLEQKKIINGRGKKHLKDINDYYKRKGYETLQFHSLERKTRKIE